MNEQPGEDRRVLNGLHFLALQSSERLAMDELRIKIEILLDSEPMIHRLPQASKEQLAWAIMDEICDYLERTKRKRK